MKAYKVIIATTQKKLRLKRIAVKPNYFATFLMDQNSLPSLAVGAGIHPIVPQEHNLTKFVFSACSVWALVSCLHRQIISSAFQFYMSSTAVYHDPNKDYMFLRIPLK